MLYPLKLQPSFKDYLWGGTRLRDEYGKATTMDPVAESWELSCHPDGPSTITNGTYQGKTLAEYLAELGPGVLGTKADPQKDFPLLIKFIDAKQNLSVQVHPDDAYANLHENSQGKTEMWYVMDAKPGASLIYGFAKDISHLEFQERIENNTLLEVCNQVPIQKGDVFFIEAGTLHAIGAGALIAEIQQNSNCTYRVYDYGRLDKDGNPRQLHIDKALAVTKLEKMVPATKPLAIQKGIADYTLEILVQCPLFNVSKFKLEGNCNFHAGRDSFHSILVLDGEVNLSYKNEALNLRKGDSVFVPANLGDYRINGAGDFLLTTL